MKMLGDNFAASITGSLMELLATSGVAALDDIPIKLLKGGYGQTTNGKAPHPKSTSFPRSVVRTSRAAPETCQSSLWRETARQESTNARRSCGFRQSLRPAIGHIEPAQ